MLEGAVADLSHVHPEVGTREWLGAAFERNAIGEPLFVTRAGVHAEFAEPHPRRSCGNRASPSG